MNSEFSIFRLLRLSENVIPLYQIPQKEALADQKNSQSLDDDREGR